MVINQASFHLFLDGHIDIIQLLLIFPVCFLYACEKIYSNKKAFKSFFFKLIYIYFVPFLYTFIVVLIFSYNVLLK